MEKIVEQTLLFDFYGELLTEHQKEIFGDHVLNDMTSSEIAKEHQITRQAAYDMLRRCNTILSGYEERLHLVEKFLHTKDKVKEIHTLSKQIMESDDRSCVADGVKRIEEVSNAILEEF